MYILASYPVKTTSYEHVVLYIINNNKTVTFSKKGQILYAYNKTQTSCTQPPGFFCLVLLLFLSCYFSTNGPFSWLFFLETQIFFVKS